METSHIIVVGKVQGVGFRSFVLGKAHNFSVKGTVTNRMNPREVEIYVQGLKSKVEGFVSEVRKGPLFGRVDSIHVHKVDMDAFKDFRIV